MPKVFICYRRDDSAYPAQQIYDAVTSRFGDESVAFDVENFPLGTDFREYLTEQVSHCDVLLAVIGDRWVALLNDRLDDPRDFVRVEIEAALEAQKPIVPVLIGRASMPREEDLPAHLARLSYYNAAAVRAGRDLQAHLRHLLEGLDDLLKKQADVEEDKKRSKAAAQRRLRKAEEAEGRFEEATVVRDTADDHRRAQHGETRRRAATAKGAPTWEDDEKLNRRIPIQGGEFMMGSPEGVGDDDERPQHRVRLSSFYIKEHPVTNEEYRRFDASHRLKKGQEKHPVVHVSWTRARAYAEWLGGDLPTEAQWEYAARAGTTTLWFFGDDEGQLRDHAWFSENSGLQAHPVAKKEPNPWGLYDMHGNVWEWCLDWYGKYPEDPQVDPLNTDVSSGRRVVRGGSFDYPADDARSAIRDGLEPGCRNFSLGFRVVLPAP